MGVFYVVVMVLERRVLSDAENKATRVYGSPLPGIFLCSVISGCGTGRIKITVVQSCCRQPVQAGVKNESDSQLLLT